MNSYGNTFLFQPSQTFNEPVSMQFSQLKVASLRFLSTLLCSSTYTDILVLPKSPPEEQENTDDVKSVLKAVMKMMTQKAVLFNPIREWPLIILTLSLCYRLISKMKHQFISAG